MPLIHQQDDFKFYVAFNFQEPPYVHVIRGKGSVTILIGDPDGKPPQIDESETVPQKDLDSARSIVRENQDQFLVAWNRSHGDL